LLSGPAVPILFATYAESHCGGLVDLATRGRANRYPERSRRWHPLKKTGEKR